jgi:hypothetical protein
MRVVYLVSVCRIMTKKGGMGVWGGAFWDGKGKRRPGRVKEEGHDSETSPCACARRIGAAPLHAQRPFVYDIYRASPVVRRRRRRRKNRSRRRRRRRRTPGPGRLEDQRKKQYEAMPIDVLPLLLPSCPSSLLRIVISQPIPSHIAPNPNQASLPLLSPSMFSRKKQNEKEKKTLQFVLMPQTPTQPPPKTNHRPIFEPYVPCRASATTHFHCHLQQEKAS